MLINRLNVVSTLCKDTQLSPKTQYQNALGDKILLILKQVFTILKLFLDFSQRRTGLFVSRQFSLVGCPLSKHAIF